MKITSQILRVGLTLLGISSTAQAVVVYQDNFDAGTSGANWTSVLSGGDGSVDYNYDYGTSMGVPSAPSSSGTTKGMRFLVNQSAGVFAGISAVPTAQSFVGDFKLTFDMWLNYAGPLGPGGNGTTQLATFGWGADGTTAQWPSASSSIMMGATLDGGSASDYRLYRNNAVDNNLANYAAGAQNNSAAYYTGAFAGQTAPSGQLTLFPGQTGTTDAGEVAFRWMQVELERVNNALTWKMNGTLIATADTSVSTVTGSNIFFGLSDTNATSSTDPNDFLITAIYDNIVVTQVPEPASAPLLLLGGLRLVRRRAHRR